MGTFAPDLEYFIRLAAGSGWGHTFSGVFGMSLPLGLVALWLFHRLVKVPLVYLLPESVRARLSSQLAPFRFGPPMRYLNIVVSLLVGVITHVIWDSVTHRGRWLDRLVPWLHHFHRIPVLGGLTVFGMLQILSSVAGLVILAVWSRRWYRRTQPDPQAPVNPFTPHHRHLVVVMGVAAAAAGAVLRAWVGVGLPRNPYETDDFLGLVVVTFGALVWWQLALWGLLGPFRGAGRRASEEETYMQSRASVEQ